MDKNLVNIDDLVRQRLLGGEEKERAGAWARMSELLEEEMPRRRGAFMWRRTYSALGILLLVGAISLGGYELNKFRDLGNASDNTVAATAPAVNGNSNAVAYNNTTADNSTTNNTTANTEHNTIASNTEKQTTNNNEPNKTNSSQTNKLIAANNIENSKKQTTQSPSRKTEAVNNNVTTRTANSSVLASNTTTRGNTKNQKAQIPGATVAATNNEVVTNDAVANNNKPVKNGNSVAHTDAVNENNNDVSANEHSNTVTKPGTTAKLVVKTNNSVAKTETSKSAPVSSGADNGIVTNKTATEVAPVKTERRKRAESGNTEQRNSAKREDNTTAIAKKTETETHNKTKTGTEVAAVTKTTPAPKTENEEKAVAHVSTKPAGNTPVKTDRSNSAKSSNDLTILNSSAPAGKPAVAMVNKVAATKTAPAKPAKIAAIPRNTKVKPVAPATSGMKTTASNTVVAATNNSARVPASFSNKIPAPTKADKNGATEMKDIAMVNSRKHKRVIEKLVVLQRYLKNSTKENDLKLDTISIESITEEYEVASAERADAAKNGNSVAISADPDMDSSPMKPGASSESFSMSAKETNNKQPVGAKTLENLNAAFNDIKYNAGNATFAMGVTGGLNRTFFGPNNFMGFQFGLSSVLSFGQSLSLMAELKYFNRLNNNYNLHDDYYQYTDQGNGSFKRELVSNPYSIATLQSIELPIAVRYTTGRFNFAIGPNVVYTFNVNAGNYKTVDPDNNATYVSAMGNDNTSKLKADDFNSRFGLGYLFGVSYQVSPKVTIDLRDVQTIWDNAKTDGAKSVSTQLFRSPSFQLSLGYRFGGGNKEK